jgi:hypothetical protein
VHIHTHTHTYTYTPRNTLALYPDENLFFLFLNITFKFSDLLNNKYRRLKHMFLKGMCIVLTAFKSKLRTLLNYYLWRILFSTETTCSFNFLGSYKELPKCFQKDKRSQLFNKKDEYNCVFVLKTDGW